MNTRGMDIKDVLIKIEEFGFERLLEIPFSGDEDRQEFLYIYFHYDYGILLQFDTYGNHVNGGHYYYQWMPDKCNSYHLALQSGGWIRNGKEIFNVWSGDADCREDMFENITALARDGKFITPWIKSDGICAPTFIHYGDHRAKRNKPWVVEYKMYCDALKTKTPERFKMLPLAVQEAIRNGMRSDK